MKFSFKNIFNIRGSLKKQILVFTIIPIVIVFLLFTYISVSTIISGGEERIKAYREHLSLKKKETIIDIEEMVTKEKEKIQGEISSLVLKNVIISIFIVLIIILVINYFVTRLINKPVEQITETIKNFNNDLTVKVPITTNNEIGEIARGFNNHIANLYNIIKKVFDAVIDINSYGSKVATAIQQQATTTSQLAAAVAEITSTTEELSASSTHIATHSSSVVDIATKTLDNTKKGAKAAESIIVKMNEINRDNQNNIKDIIELGRKSKEITKVMEIINTIADQTKLIAFNAAIEASSAGEAGRRFGVVAVEIRRLADSVMESTGEIESKINEIQEAINRLVIASEKGSKGIQSGVEFSHQSAQTLSDIVNAAQATTDAAKQISLSTQQQKTASSQVVSALREIMAGSEQTSDAINQISSVTEELAKLSDNLKRLLEQFKLDEQVNKVVDNR